MPLGRLSMLGFGLVLLATPVQAATCRSACGGDEACAKRNDAGALSIRLERTLHSVRAFDFSQAQLPDLPAQRSDLLRRRLDFHPPGLAKKQYMSLYPPGLAKKQDSSPYPPGLAKKQYLSPSYRGNGDLEPSSTRGQPHQPASAVPEPTAALLFGVGLLTLQSVVLRRRI